MISGPSANDPTVEVHYTWDAWDRLVAVYADDGNGGMGSLIASYSYDGLNRRIQKVVAAAGSNPAVTTDYYYNQNWQVVEETTTPAGGSTRATHYVWDERGVDTPVASFSSSGQTLYYLTDANGNVTSLVDPNAAGGPAVVERYTYDAYGDVTVLQADWSLQTVSGHADGTTSAYGNEILYAGYRQDPETGLYQVENRYYEAPLDTWLSRDPAGYAASGDDLYNYCGGRPTTNVNPTGAAMINSSDLTNPPLPGAPIASPQCCPLTLPVFTPVNPSFFPLALDSMPFPASVLYAAGDTSLPMMSSLTASPPTLGYAATEWGCHLQLPTRQDSEQCLYHLLNTQDTSISPTSVYADSLIDDFLGWCGESWNGIKERVTARRG